MSVDHIGAQQAFAEKLGVTYPLLDDFSRSTARQYGVLDTEPQSGFYHYAKRAYFIIDKQGIIRFKHIMDAPGHLLDSEVIFGEVKKVAQAASSH